jgi:hypothetical protein
MQQNQGQYGGGTPQKAVAHIEQTEKASVMHYRENKGKFLKIYVTLPKFVN